MSDWEKKRDGVSGAPAGAKPSAGRSVLGRGLGSLIPVGLEPGMAGPESFWCPVEKIRIAQVQPRVDFNNRRLADLAASIAHSGILQPVVVRRDGDEYVIVAGERRTRAAKMAGLTKIPVVVKDVSPEEAYELALVENVQREDLGPLEEAEAYKRLLEERGYTQEQLASRLGKDRTTIANFLRLLKLPEPLKELVQSGELMAGHARALLGLPEESEQIKLGILAVEQGYSVRVVEQAVRQRRARAGGEQEGAPRRRRRTGRSGQTSQEYGEVPAFVPELPSLPDLPPLPDLTGLAGRPGPDARVERGESELDSYSSHQLANVLEERLGLGVRLRAGEGGGGGGRGVVEIAYGSRADLLRLVRLLSS